MPHNIEKSAFHRGEYVGYGNGKVWRIRRTSSNDWCAIAHTVGYCHARTLAALSALIDNG